jgi:ABC-type proline/glycine betaine transport system substrate-binding protein
MQLEMDELEALMARGQDVGVRQAVVEYIQNNMDKVRYWVTGQR